MIQIRETRERINLQLRYRTFFNESFSSLRSFVSEARLREVLIKESLFLCNIVKRFETIVSWSYPTKKIETLVRSRTIKKSFLVVNVRELKWSWAISSHIFFSWNVILCILPTNITFTHIETKFCGQCLWLDGVKKRFIETRKMFPSIRRSGFHEMVWVRNKVTYKFSMRFHL